MFVMDTTIQVSDELRMVLKERKLGNGESYEAVIWDLLEDALELSEETKKEIAESRKEAAAGKLKPLAQIKKEQGL
jgi:hypothetical protein